MNFDRLKFWTGFAYDLVYLTIDFLSTYRSKKRRCTSKWLTVKYPETPIREQLTICYFLVRRLELVTILDSVELDTSDSFIENSYLFSFFYKHSIEVEL